MVQGVFPLLDAHGVPLDLVLDRLRTAGMIPDWLELERAARAAGWKRIENRLAEAIGDVYGPTFLEGWRARFTGETRP